MTDKRSRAYARFCLNIISERGPYCACDLKEGWLRAWQGTELPHNAYWKLATGNKDERNLFYLMCETQAENAPSVEIRLTGKEIDSIKNFLDGVYEDDRDETDSCITADGWDSYFYLEFDDGTPPLSIKTYLSYSAFADKMYCFLYQRFELWKPTDFSYVKWDKKRPAEAERELVQDALEAGIDAVYHLLYGGKAAQIKMTEDLRFEEPLEYCCDYPESFTIKMGHRVSRSCKLCEMPKCVHVFGPSHRFEQRSQRGSE